MRTALILSIVAACSSPGVGVSLESGPLIAMSEGDPPRHIHVSGASKLTSDVMWAKFDGPSGDLVLDPPCTTVAGTLGAPKLFYMQLDTTPIVVQVQPSGGGSCAPTLNGCITDACGADCATDALGSGPIALDDQAANATHAITFTINNLDSLPVTVHATTDAPIRFKQTPQSKTICAVAPNANIVGPFVIDWVVAESPGSENSPVIASGEYRLNWNLKTRYGLEVDWCAADGASCMLHRTTQGSADWCIDTVNHAMTLGLSLWVQPNMEILKDHQVTAALRSGNPVTLTSTSTRSSLPAGISVQLDRYSIPAMLTADLGMVANNDTLTLTTSTTDDSSDVHVAIMPSCP